MSVYLDASFIVPLFINQEPLTARASDFLDANTPELVVSDFAGAEFGSAIARLTRMGAVTTEQAAAIFADFDAWMARVAMRAETTATDVAMAGSFIRGLALNIRTPDAINIAIAQRTGATLATFDSRMADNAAALGLPVAVTEVPP